MKNYSILFIISLFATYIHAQDSNAGAKINSPDQQYRRSSLHLMMIDDPERPMSVTIKKSFTVQPVPEKFNDHSLSLKSFPVDKLSVVPAYDLLDQINKNNLGREAVAKWFSRNASTGTLNMNLVAERGFYNASDLDVKKAKASKRGMSTIGDAGEELIKNTFLVVCDFKYINKEELGTGVAIGFKLAGDIAAAATGNKNLSKAGDVAAVAAVVASKGYIVKTTVFLYQLVWNDSVSAVFYNDLWNDESAPDAGRKAKFENSNLFQYKYVGTATSYADVQSTIFTNKSEEELIAMATKNATESALVKLEKSYETFRTKTPLYSVKPLRAKIGLKEGLKGNQRYFVYEKRLNDEGKTVYKKVASIRVKCGSVYDNQFVATGDPVDVNKLTRFYQTTGRRLMPGMLIQQRLDRGFFKPFNVFFGQFGRMFH
ncbi:MAG: hypothetical protein NW207_04505 [Cytophagales bacterium]|nr:hypothetical protein [Cytophagales bacterium]